MKTQFSLWDRIYRLWKGVLWGCYWNRHFQGLEVWNHNYVTYECPCGAAVTEAKGINEQIMSRNSQKPQDKV